MFYKGEPWNPASMVDAQLHGISMVLQEANTIPNCTVAENIFAGRFNEFATANSFLNMRKVNKAAQELLNRFGLEHIKATDSINKYGFEDRKLIEIVRCVSDETEVFVVDETTTALSHEGRQLLYKLIHRLKDENKSVIFISHDMDEILEQCTDLTVLRDGDIIGHLNRAEMDAPDSVKTIRCLLPRGLRQLSSARGRTEARPYQPRPDQGLLAGAAQGRDHRFRRSVRLRHARNRPRRLRP